MTALPRGLLPAGTIILLLVFLTLFQEDTWSRRVGGQGSSGGGSPTKWRPVLYLTRGLQARLDQPPTVPGAPARKTPPREDVRDQQDPGVGDGGLPPTAMGRRTVPEVAIEAAVLPEVAIPGGKLPEATAQGANFPEASIRTGNSQEVLPRRDEGAVKSSGLVAGDEASRGVHSRRPAGALKDGVMSGATKTGSAGKDPGRGRTGGAGKEAGIGTGGARDGADTGGSSSIVADGDVTQKGIRQEVIAKGRLVKHEAGAGKQRHEAAVDKLKQGAGAADRRLGTGEGAAGDMSHGVAAEDKGRIGPQREEEGAGEEAAEEFTCDWSASETDVCLMKGDVRVDLMTAEVWLVAKDRRTREAAAFVRPYPRKFQRSAMARVSWWKLATFQEGSTATDVVAGRAGVDPPPDGEGRGGAATETMGGGTGEARGGGRERGTGFEVRVGVSSGQSPPACEHHHDVPAVVFSGSGFAGNFFHEVIEIQIPLFISTFRFNRDVVLIASDIDSWWAKKYAALVRALSKHPVLNPALDKGVHCFPRVEIGVRSHGPLVVDPNRMEPRGASLADLTKRILAVERLPPPPSIRVPGAPYQLALIRRTQTRRLLNEAAVVDAARQAGFSVSVIESFGGSLPEVVSRMQSVDVLVGVHGAALSNLVYMRPATVVAQIVPFGLSGYGSYSFGNARRYLQYLGVETTWEESSLSDGRKPECDRTRADDEAAFPGGWQRWSDCFLAQDVTVDVEKIKAMLIQAKTLLDRSLASQR